MAETSQFGLPLLSNSQAQKSVTVNESLSILDAVAQLRFVSSTITDPPVAVVDGEAFWVSPGATGEWFGQDRTIAIACNGGWRFVIPKIGWNAYNIETGTSQLFDGTNWLDCTLAATASGTATEYEIVEIDFDLSAATSLTTVDIIPANAQVVGVTGRVTQSITGSLTNWSLGVNGSSDRFGQGLGIALNSYILGMSNTPTTYYIDTPLVLTANGGDFSQGQVKLAVHFVKLVPPRAI